MHNFCPATQLTAINLYIDRFGLRGKVPQSAVLTLGNQQLTTGHIRGLWPDLCLFLSKMDAFSFFVVTINCSSRLTAVAPVVAVLPRQWFLSCDVVTVVGLLQTRTTTEGL